MAGATSIYSRLCTVLFQNGYENAPYITLAILDAGRWPGILHRLREHDGEWLPLCTGYVGSALYDTLPYVTEISQNSLLLRDLADNFGKRNYLFVRLRKKNATGEKQNLLSFVTHFLYIPHVLLAPHAEPAWMRIYDPEIFQDFWGIADTEQKCLLRGDCVHSFIAEAGEQQSFFTLEPPEDFHSVPVPRIQKRLVITLEQQEALGTMYAERFIRQLIASVAEQLAFPQKSRLLSPLAEKVRQSVSQAETFGLSDDDDIKKFVHLDAAHAWELMGKNTAASIMHETRLEPTTRLNILLQSCAHAVDSQESNDMEQNDA